MKQLVCEMCESTDFLKQEGMFVCQSCGIKYTLEEAKKLMVEVEATGVVPVSAPAPIQVPSTQVTNLLNLAQTSFDSKNYAQAEEFCNQVIALDGTNYEAWKLKGEAINYQIGTNNQRILEVFNCIMTAYRVLNEEEQAEKKYEILSLLKDCLEGEVTFWVSQFEEKRPTDDTLLRTKNAYVDAYNKMGQAFEELGLEESKAGYLSNFDNFFVRKANAACVASWKDTVAYNYFRKDLSNLGASWNRNLSRKEYGTDYYRPDNDIFSTFLDETGILIEMLKFCEKQFNDETEFEQKKDIFSNIAYFYEVPMNQYSYKPMVTTWTNGYGAVTSRQEYYEIDHYLTTEAKNIRQREATIYRRKAKEAEAAAAEKKRQEEIEKREAAAREAKRQKDERVERYWQEHPEEKAALQAEQAEIHAKLDELKPKIDALAKKNEPEVGKLIAKRTQKLPSELEADAQQTLINQLESEKNELGVFKGKEKKALQERIDTVERPKLYALRKQAEEDRLAYAAEINQQIAELQKELVAMRQEVESLSKRNTEIARELTQDR